MERFRVGDLSSGFVELVHSKGLDADRNGVLDRRDLGAIATAKTDSQDEVEKLYMLRDAITTGRAPRTRFVAQRIEAALQLFPAEQPWLVARFPNGVFRPLLERPPTLQNKASLDDDSFRAMSIDERLRLLATYQSEDDVDDVARAAVDKIPAHQRELFRAAVQGEKYEVAAKLIAARRQAWEQERVDELSLLPADERLAWLSEFAAAGRCADPAARELLQRAPAGQYDALAARAKAPAAPCAVLTEREVNKLRSERQQADAAAALAAELERRKAIDTIEIERLRAVSAIEAEKLTLVERERQSAAAAETDRLTKLEQARQASLALENEQKKAEREFVRAAATRQDLRLAERAIVAAAKSTLASSSGSEYEQCIALSAVIRQAAKLEGSSGLGALVAGQPSCGNNGAYHYAHAVVTSIAAYVPAE
ncbi:MAG: hypothetical protein IT381_19695 [Deltaproteobacteria bacterium]|nr:hypothetical protein [Deltaproteobacteria bacterium]